MNDFRSHGLAPLDPPCPTSPHGSMPIRPRARACTHAWCANTGLALAAVASFVASQLASVTTTSGSPVSKMTRRQATTPAGVAGEKRGGAGDEHLVRRLPLAAGAHVRLDELPAQARPGHRYAQGALQVLAARLDDF